MQNEFLKEIKKNSSSRSLRTALLKYSEICHLLNPIKYHVGSFFNFLTNIVKRSDDDLLQDTLLQATTKIFPIFTTYCPDKEITIILDAYLANLSSPSSTVRRSASLSIVNLCSNTRRAYRYFLLLLNKLLILISSIRINESINSEYLLSGVFMTIKVASPKLALLLDDDSNENLNASVLLTENLYYIYKHIVLCIKQSTNNIVIVSALEALTEFLKFFPLSIHNAFANLSQNNCEFKNSDYSNLLTQISKESKIYESNLSISSSINYIEDINDEFNDEMLRKTTVCLMNNRDDEDEDDKCIDIGSEFNDSEVNESFDYYDRENDLDISISETKSPDIDTISTCSFNTNRKSQMSFEYQVDNTEWNLNQVSLEDYDLGKAYSLEYTSKLICLKYLLKGVSNQLIEDDEVRISIKSLALSCFSSIVYIYPQVLYLEIRNGNIFQQLSDVLQFSNHSDPNLRGQVAIIIGNFFDQVLSLPVGYEEFLLANVPNKNETFHLDFLMKIFCDILRDSSSITVKHAILSLKQFLPKLLKSNEFEVNEVLKLVECLITLKNHTYWLIKVELINLFSVIPFIYLCYFEQIMKSKLSVNDDKNLYMQKCSSLSKIILEEIIFSMLFDDDHRIRQAVVNSLDNLIRNLYLKNFFFDDPLNLLAFQTMLSNFGNSYDSKIFTGAYPNVENFFSPIDYSTKMDTIFSLNITDNMKNILIESNLLYFTSRLIFEISHNFEKKTFMIGAINALSTLAKTFPPHEYLNGWGLGLKYPVMAEKPVETIYFLIDLLTKNPIVMFDFFAHQNLISLLISLIESTVYSLVNVIQFNHDKFTISSHEQFLNLLSPDFAKYIEQLFIHLFKILVAYCAIIDENSSIFTTFIYNFHCKNVTQFASSLKNRSNVFFDVKSKENIARKHFSNKSVEKHESQKFDPLYFKLYEHLKSYLSSKRSSYINKNDRAQFIAIVLNSLSKLFEILNASFFYCFLDGFLLYLQKIFYQNCTEVVRCVKQVLKCIFNVNYVSLFVEVLNEGPNELLKQYHCSANGSAKVTKLFEVNSLYNNLFSMSYIQFNDFYNSYSTKNDDTNKLMLTNLSCLRKWVDLKNLKVVSVQNDKKTSQDFNLEKFLSVKIHSFEPLVNLSIKHYRISNNTQFQSQVLDFLTELVQFHINYSLLDPDNYFLDYILRQFELLENAQNSEQSQCLVKRLFYFLATLSREHYISTELVNISKIIQLCDGLIANGHNQLAIDGLYIIIDNIFYYYCDFHSNNDLADLEAQREVVLAYCYKLIGVDQVFELLRLVANYYKCFNKVKWYNLSKEIMNMITLKLSQNVIQIHDIQCFENLQSLIYDLCSTAFIESVNFVEYFVEEFVNCQNSPIQKCFAKFFLYLKLALFNLNEDNLLTSLKLVQQKFNLQLCKQQNDKCEDKLSIEEFFVGLLFSILERSITESANIQLDNSSGESTSKLQLYLLSHYNLLITFVFQSGYYTKLTICATNYIRSLSKSIKGDHFNFHKTHQTFLNFSIFYPNITVSWLNLLYVLNYDNLQETLSNCIDPKSQTDKAVYSDYIHTEIVKRCSIFLLCDFLSENLENVEYLSWIIINHLWEIINLCNESPVKDFIISIHRKSSSSGLFLQAVNSRSVEILSSSLLSSKILDCLERAHFNQSLPLVMFLLEKFLFNEQLAGYYKCCKYAENIISNRLLLSYDLKSSECSINSEKTLSIADINNLLQILKNTSYNKLYMTVKMIKDKFYSKTTKPTKIKDPLTETKRPNIEINKIWYMDLIANYLSQPQKNTMNIIILLDKLSNEDIIQLVSSSQFEITSLKHILLFIIENVNEQEKLIKSKIFSDFNRVLLIKSIFSIIESYTKSIYDRYRLKNISKDNISERLMTNRIRDDECFFHFCISFMGVIECFVNNWPFFEKHVELNSSFHDALLNLLATNASFVYYLHFNDNFLELINLLQLIKTCLMNPTLFLKLSAIENIHLQSSLIDCVFYLFSQRRCFVCIFLLIKLFW